LIPFSAYRVVDGKGTGIFSFFFRHKDIRPQCSDQERKHPFLRVIFAQFFCGFRVFFCGFRVFFLRKIRSGIAGSGLQGMIFFPFRNVVIADV